MSDPLLIDTDVLIDFLRGFPKAVLYLKSLPAPFTVSAITIAELYAGVREGREREVLDEFVASLNVVQVTEQIAVKGGLFRRDYIKSHNVGLPDALIAATAEEQKAILVTLNKKHFPMLANVFVPYQKP